MQQARGLDQHGDGRRVVVGARRGPDGVVVRAEDYDFVFLPIAGKLGHDIGYLLVAGGVCLTGNFVAGVCELSFNIGCSRLERRELSKMAWPDQPRQAIDVAGEIRNQLGVSAWSHGGGRRCSEFGGNFGSIQLSERLQPVP